MGWGGLGMMAFLALAHMWDATQLMGWGGLGMMAFLALAHMWDATQLMGWGGLGMMAFLALAHMWDATQLMGWGGLGMMAFLALAHMWDATQLMGWGGLGMMAFLALAHMGLASQAERPKPVVGHGKDVPQSQVETQLGTSRSQNKKLKTNGSVLWKYEANKANVDMIALLPHSHWSLLATLRVPQVFQVFRRQAFSLSTFPTFKRNFYLFKRYQFWKNFGSLLWQKQWKHHVNLPDREIKTFCSSSDLHPKTCKTTKYWKVANSENPWNIQTSKNSRVINGDVALLNVR